MTGGPAPRSEYRFRNAIPTLAWIRDAGWPDAWYLISYPFKTWRCRLFGHKWGPEKHDYEIGVRTQSWRDCERKNCEGFWETYHYLAGGKDRVWG